ncbi:MAG: type II toxin-antitoxin system prevent-host-death family antitoxin [Solirubrobacterales bacterium]|nr:type II toxin-antitoxin system prevent-host-death family antitoxin [Solirubrobacterales bacterium]
MATRVAQRELRNNTADLLRRVERGERLQITVHGHPVAELGPIGSAATFVPVAELAQELSGMLDPGDQLDRELRQADAEPRDPFE